MPEAHDRSRLRSAKLAQRLGRPLLLRAWLSYRIARRALSLSAWGRGSLVLAYFPVRGEVDTRGLVRRALGSGKKVALPRVGRPGKIDFYLIQSLAGLKPGRYGIPEPAASPGARVSVERADMILVPGLAFSFDGHRLGYGGGCYDRVLPRRRGVSLGLAFDSQLCGRLPAARHDARLDALVTERRILIFGSARDKRVKPH